MFMFADSTDVEMTTPPAVGVPAAIGVNSLTMPSPALSELATNRLPLESKVRAKGPFSPVSVAVGAMLPGANSLTMPYPLLSELDTYRLPLESKVRA